MPHLIRWLLLLSCTAIWVHTQQKVDLNHLLYSAFLISKNDSKFMEDLQQHFVTTDGTIDKAAYDMELKRSHPSLHQRMVEFRRNYSEIYRNYPGAARFVEVLYRGAQNVRNHQDESEQTKAVLGNFNGLSKAAQDYLIKYFPAFHTLRSLTSQKPPSGVTTTKPAATTPTPSSKSKTAEMDQLANVLEKAMAEIASPVAMKLEILLKKIRKFATEPSPSPDTFSLVFIRINEAAKALEKCEGAKDCHYAETPLANVLEAFLKAAVEANPKNLELKQTSDRYYAEKKADKRTKLSLIRRYSEEAGNATS